MFNYGIWKIYLVIKKNEWNNVLSFKYIRKGIYMDNYLF